MEREVWKVLQPLRFELSPAPSYFCPFVSFKGTCWELHLQGWPACGTCVYMYVCVSQCGSEGWQNPNAGTMHLVFNILVCVFMCASMCVCVLALACRDL